MASSEEQVQPPGYHHHLNKAAFSAAIFKRGQKAELFSADHEEGIAPGDEAAELAGKLGELHSVWDMARTGRDLAAAIWRPHLGAAEVVLQKGKLLAHMGFTRGPKTYLFIEEAVYLMDRANLLLFLDGSSGSGSGQRQGKGQQQEGQQRVLSLQEGYDLMAGAEVPIASYLIFCKLLRAGYIVQRHGARWALGPGEDVGANVRAAAWGVPPMLAQGVAQQAQQSAQQSVQQSAAAAAALPAGPPHKKQKVAAQEQQQCSGKWWVASVEPGAAAAGAVDGQAPPAQGQQEQGQQEQQQQQQQEAPEAGSTPAADGSNGAASRPPAAQTWAASNPWLAGLPASFLEALPRCQVLPTPAQRAAADFPRLAPLQGIPLGDLQPLGGAAAGRHLLHYDVFLSNARFSRKQPGAPACVVAVLPCTRAPTPEIMAAADVAAGGIPVRFATLEKGDICFYGYTHVELRSILR